MFLDLKRTVRKRSLFQNWPESPLIHRKRSKHATISKQFGANISQDHRWSHDFLHFRYVQHGNLSSANGETYIVSKSPHPNLWFSIRKSWMTFMWVRTELHGFFDRPQSRGQISSNLAEEVLRRNLSLLKNHGQVLVAFDLCAILAFFSWIQSGLQDP